MNNYNLDINVRDINNLSNVRSLQGSGFATPSTLEYVNQQLPANIRLVQRNGRQFIRLIEKDRNQHIPFDGDSLQLDLSGEVMILYVDKRSMFHVAR